METMLIIDAVITIFGIFLAYIGIQMKRTGNINSILVAEEELAKCKDQKGYITYTAPRILVFAVIVALCGIAGILGAAVVKIPYLNYVILGVFLVAFGTYTVQMRKARNEFFYG